MERKCHDLISHYVGSCLEGLEGVGDTCQGSPCPRLDSNTSPPEYESHCVTMTPTLSVRCCDANNNRHMPHWISQCETCLLVHTISVPLLFPLHRVYAEVWWFSGSRNGSFRIGTSLQTEQVRDWGSSTGSYRDAFSSPQSPDGVRVTSNFISSGFSRLKLPEGEGDHSAPYIISPISLPHGLTMGTYFKISFQGKLW